MEIFDISERLSRKTNTGIAFVQCLYYTPLYSWAFSICFNYIGLARAEVQLTSFVPLSALQHKIGNLVKMTVQTTLTGRQHSWSLEEAVESLRRGCQIHQAPIGIHSGEDSRMRLIKHLVLKAELMQIVSTAGHDDQYGFFDLTFSKDQITVEART